MSPDECVWMYPPPVMQVHTHLLEQNQLKDKDNVYDFFLDKSHVLSRVNRHVLAKSRAVDLSSPGERTLVMQLRTFILG